MIDDLSLLFSDNAYPDDVNVVHYVNRDTIAVRYGDRPKNVEDYDAIEYNFGLYITQAETIANERLRIRNQMAQENKMR